VAKTDAVAKLEEKRQIVRRAELPRESAAGVKVPKRDRAAYMREYRRATK